MPVKFAPDVLAFDAAPKRIQQAEDDVQCGVGLDTAAPVNLKGVHRHEILFALYAEVFGFANASGCEIFRIEAVTLRKSRRAEQG